MSHDIPKKEQETEKVEGDASEGKRFGEDYVRNFEVQHVSTDRLVENAEKSPSAEQIDDDLQKKMGSLTSLKEQLRETVKGGAYENLEPEDKARFRDALNKLDYLALHQFAKPMDLEKEMRNLQGEVRYLEVMLKEAEVEKSVLTGEIGRENIRQVLYEKFRLGTDATNRLEALAKKLDDIPEDTKKEMLAKLDEYINNFPAAEEKVKAMVVEKSIPEDQPGMLQSYQTRMKTYEEIRADARDLNRDIRERYLKE